MSNFASPSSTISRPGDLMREIKVCLLGVSIGKVSWRVLSALWVYSTLSILGHRGRKILFGVTLRFRSIWRQIEAYHWVSGVFIISLFKVLSNVHWMIKEGTFSAGSWEYIYVLSENCFRLQLWRLRKQTDWYVTNCMAIMSPNPYWHIPIRHVHMGNFSSNRAHQLC